MFREIMDHCTKTKSSKRLSCGTCEEANFAASKQEPILLALTDCAGIRRIAHHLQEQGGDGQMTPVLRLWAGACAGIIGMSATYPLDMVRGRLTVQGGEGQVQQYKGIVDATVKIVRQVGIPAVSASLF